MTICIAAICEEGKAIVAASDKMITYLAPPYHQFEHPRSKLQIVAKQLLWLQLAQLYFPQNLLT